MNQMRIVMRLVPGKYWDNEDDPATAIKPFVEDALAIERRLPKEVNLKNEMMRYQLCCVRIQEAVCRLELDTEKESLDPVYLEWLRAVEAISPDGFALSRLSACFFPPDSLGENINKMEALLSKVGEVSSNNDVNKRLDFLRTAFKKKAGVVEAMDFLDAPESEAAAPEPLPDLYVAGEPNARVSMADDVLSNEERKSLIENLKEKMEQALKTGAPVNFSNQPHSVITEALNYFVYKENGWDVPATLRVIYMDGTEAEPFPVRCLIRQERENLKDGLPLKAALVSMRHLKMDDVVDFAWFRNRRVSTPAAPFAENVAYCTATTRELLQGLTDGDALILHIYQTGLETAVVGFYRGLVQFLCERQANGKLSTIQVVPFYFDGRDNGYKGGTRWD